MNVLQLPNLNENAHITQPTVINGKSYMFTYNWVDDFCTLDIYLNDEPLLKGRAMTTGSDLISRIKNDNLIIGSLFLVNKFGQSVQPIQENFHTDYYLIWEE